MLYLWRKANPFLVYFVDKNLVFVVLIVALVGGGAWYQHHAKAPVPAAVAAAGKPVSTAAVPPSKAAAATAAAAKAELLKKQAAARAEIENALKSMKVTTLLLGEPAIVIINKEEHSVGDSLKLAGGKELQITGIDENGVALGYDGQRFHLDPPGAPELAASRRKL